MPRSFIRTSLPIRCSAAMAVCGVAVAVTLPVAQAQVSVGSREVVQALPPAGVSELNDALGRLARNSRNLNALIDAGNASLKLGDVDAAIGFFGRADDLSPGNPRVKVGLAGAFVRSERPLEALRLFDEAERAGASSRDMAAERGLAYDLVGDNARAQEQYGIAMRRSGDEEARRRLALSHAIAGNSTAFEATLLPLLQRQDRSAFRTRAFGLAILGRQDEASEIIGAVMPAAMAQGIEPYLGYMPRLTKAQQAAAANLGTFPRAAQIGRENPQIAQYQSANRPTSAASDTRLEPAGKPLGPRVAQAEPAAPAEPQEKPERRVRRSIRDASDPMLRARPPRRVAVRQPAAAAPAASAVDVATRAATQTASAASAIPAATVNTPTASTSGSATMKMGELPPVQGSAQPVQTVQVTPVTAPVNERPTPAQVALAGIPVTPVTQVRPQAVPPEIAAAAPGFDLARVGSEIGDTATETVSVRPSITRSEPVTQPVPEPASVADAFADLSMPDTATVPASSRAVDITSIEPPRDREENQEVVAEPAPPENPKRFWVQVATGQNRSALKFDWRRFARKAPEVLGELEPFVASWNSTNRLLAGPFDSSRAARNALNALTEAGVDGFQFTSAEGEEVSRLP